MSDLHVILLASEGDGLAFVEILVVWTDGLEKLAISILHLRVLVC